LVSSRPTAWLLDVSWSWSREEREREREKKGKETCEVDDGNRRWGELPLFFFDGASSVPLAPFDLSWTAEPLRSAHSTRKRKRVKREFDAWGREAFSLLLLPSKKQGAAAAA
jgi:hypothetical protein